MSLTADQVALIAAVAHRERTARELATSLGAPAGEIERQLRSLAKAGFVEARMDRCPLCQHIFGGRLYRPTEQGLLVLADSPLVRRTAAA
jgi:DNA-binding transcriptional ArsR family regulator